MLWRAIGAMVFGWRVCVRACARVRIFDHKTICLNIDTEEEEVKCTGTENENKLLFVCVCVCVLGGRITQNIVFRIQNSIQRNGKWNYWKLNWISVFCFENCLTSLQVSHSFIVPIWLFMCVCVFLDGERTSLHSVTVAICALCHHTLLQFVLLHSIGCVALVLPVSQFSLFFFSICMLVCHSVCERRRSLLLFSYITKLNVLHRFGVPRQTASPLSPHLSHLPPPRLPPHFLRPSDSPCCCASSVFICIHGLHSMKRIFLLNTIFCFLSLAPFFSINWKMVSQIFEKCNKRNEE